ncbi:acetoacetate-CoA ligase [Paraphysoderma sedebokerense]|nr:acetoacetate-CoA ligase [Paraphysoderma sedebokerense]
MAPANTAGTDPSPLWVPSEDLIRNSQMTLFRNYINKKYHLNLASYSELYQWSVTEIQEFWVSVIEYTGIRYSQKWDQVVDLSLPMSAIPEWFRGCRLNFAENVLQFRDDRTAIIATTESLKLRHISYAELYTLVEKMAGAFRSCGVGVGDRVCGYMANCVEAVVCMLAATSLGAIWSCTSPDFGITGVLDRFTQIKPKVLFSINAVLYNGKVHDHLAKLKAVAEGLKNSGLEKVVVIPHVPDQPMDLTNIPKSASLDDFLAAGDNQPISFVQLPFNHPLYILFSSGTTGKPKCIVHSVGGTLLQHKKEHQIHGNLSRSDVFLQYTTTGWMMWNWLVSTLSVGATIVLYEGSPFKPSPAVLWELAERLGVTVFGTSPKYLQSLQEVKYKPNEHVNLSKLHSIYSTGSPLRPENYEFVYNSIKRDVLLGSITGGTDIISLFAGHNTVLPVYKGELQCRCLGMAVEAWDSNGSKPVLGQSGDLVCTKPFPSMPVFFWNDPNMEKYRKAYFEQYTNPSVWYHGDFILISPKTGGLIVLGRSDGTLNPAGVRFGSAEIYNIIDNFKEVEDSLVVGQQRPIDKDERVCLFLKMQPGQKFTKELVDRIKSRIRAELSPRHVPPVIVEVPDIPYTVNGKKVEVAIKKIISTGLKIEPSGTLRNPECLEFYYTIPELEITAGGNVKL